MREIIKVAMLKALLTVLAKIAVSAPIIIYLRLFSNFLHRIFMCLGKGLTILHVFGHCLDMFVGVVFGMFHQFFQLVFIHYIII